MAHADYQTTMWDWLTDVASVINYANNHNELPQRIATVKRGTELSPVLPMVAILPELETYEGQFSRGWTNVRRQIIVNTTIHVFNTHEGRKDVLEISEALREQLWENTPSTAYNKEIGDVIPGPDPIRDRRGFQQNAAFTFTSWHKEEKNIADQGDTYSEPTGIQMLTAICDTLDANRNMFNQATIRGVYLPEGGTPKAIAHIPMITTVLQSEMRDDTLRGKREVKRNFALDVFTYLAAKPENLQMNISLVEVLKDVLQTNSRWGGRCITSDITSINYGFSLEEERYMYDTQVLLSCLSREAVR